MVAKLCKHCHREKQQRKDGRLVCFRCFSAAHMMANAKRFGWHAAPLKQPGPPEERITAIERDLQGIRLEIEGMVARQEVIEKALGGFSALLRGFEDRRRRKDGRQ